MYHANQGYRGSSLLPAFGDVHEYTPEEIRELHKCRDDIEYFAETYFTVVHPDKGKIIIPLYDYQHRAINHINDNRFSIFTQSRQSGKTTMMTIFILHYVLFQKDKNVALLANKERTSKMILERIKLAYELLPRFLKQTIREWNKQSVHLGNGCKIFAGATSNSAIRGETVSLLYVDECAIIENWDEFYKSTYSTITAGTETKVVFSSTANGLNHYYKLWTDAENGKSDFIPFEVSWRDVPGRDEAWRDRTIANTSIEQFMQEHENVFLGSQNTLISIASLKNLVAQNPVDIRNDGKLWVYAHPQEGRQYVATVDSAHGKNQNYSVTSIFDVTEMPYQQVAVYRDNTISPVIYPDVIFNLCHKYNDAWVLIENNDCGGIVVSNLNYDLEYEHILSPRESYEKTKAYEMGVRMTSRVKSLGCSIAKDMIEGQQLIINDQNTIDEFANFIRRGKSYEADPHNEDATDDIVMTFILFCWLTDTEIFKEILNSKDLKETLYKVKLEQIEEDLVPFGVIDDGYDHEEEYDEETGMMIVGQWPQ